MASSTSTPGAASTHGNDKPPDGGFLVALRDSPGVGMADAVARFGDSVAYRRERGNRHRAVRRRRSTLRSTTASCAIGFAGDEPPAAEPAPEAIVPALPMAGDHPMHPFVIDAEGGMFIDLASATNACQTKNRIPRSPGHEPGHAARDPRRHLALRRQSVRVRSSLRRIAT